MRRTTFWLAVASKPNTNTIPVNSDASVFPTEPSRSMQGFNSYEKFDESSGMWAVIINTAFLLLEITDGVYNKQKKNKWTGLCFKLQSDGKEKWAIKIQWLCDDLQVGIALLINPS